MSIRSRTDMQFLPSLELIADARRNLIGAQLLPEAGGLGTKCMDTLEKAGQSPSDKYHRLGVPVERTEVMENLTHYPLLVFAATFVTLWLAALAGSWLRRRDPSAGHEQNEDIGVILAATLTLSWRGLSKP